jgi:hypothetical protein
VRLPDGQSVEARVAGSARFAVGDHVTLRVHGPVLAFAGQPRCPAAH